VFVVTVMSAVLSTIDSAILAPSAILAQNLLGRAAASDASALRLDQLCVVGVASVSLCVAFVGENAYSLLESAYEIGLVSLLVPLLFGLKTTRGGELLGPRRDGGQHRPWLLHQALGWGFFAAPWLASTGLLLPTGLTCAGLATLAYLAASRA